MLEKLKQKTSKSVEPFAGQNKGILKFVHIDWTIERESSWSESKIIINLDSQNKTRKSIKCYWKIANWKLSNKGEKRNIIILSQRTSSGCLVANKRIKYKQNWWWCRWNDC